MHLCTSLCTCPMHASMHVTVYFPCACIYALHSVLALYMPLCISLSTFPAHASTHFTVCFPSRISLCTLPKHASMHFTLYLPYAYLYAFYCALSLCMPLCISLSAFRVCSRSCGNVLRVLLLYSNAMTLQPELQGRSSRTTFVPKSCDFAAGASRTTFVPKKCDFAA